MLKQKFNVQTPWKHHSVTLELIFAKNLDENNQIHSNNQK